LVQSTSKAIESEKELNYGVETIKNRSLEIANAKENLRMIKMNITREEKEILARKENVSVSRGAINLRNSIDKKTLKRQGD